MIIFNGSASADLAWEVSRKTNLELGKREIKRFPDNEIYVKIQSYVKHEECYVIQSTRSSDDFMELLLLLDALRENKASRVHAIVPYLMYMRQDKQFTEGESVSAKTILKLLNESADSITTVNCHFIDSGEGDFNYHGIVFNNIDAFPEVGLYFKGKLTDPLLIAPDNGSLGRVRKVADLMDCKFNHLKKKRISGDTVEVEAKNLGVSGKDVLILDDIISTGGTIIKAVELIRKEDPKSVNVGCVHGLFLNGVEPFVNALDRVACTNTLPTPASKISVAEAIAKTIRKR